MAHYRKCPFPVRYRETPKSDMALYRIWADGKFMIWKGLSLTQSVSLISESLHRGFSSPPKDNSATKLLQKHIEYTRTQWIEIEVIRYYNSALPMLKDEYKSLSRAKDDPRCLNTDFVPHIPKWIPMMEVRDYEKWKESLT